MALLWVVDMFNYKLLQSLHDLSITTGWNSVKEMEMRVEERVVNIDDILYE